jgi:hypothetical protein
MEAERMQVGIEQLRRAEPIVRHLVVLTGDLVLGRVNR